MCYIKIISDFYILPSVQDWSPHMSFNLKGSQISALQLKGWFKSKTSIQEYRNEIQNSYETCAWIVWYMFPIQCEELRIDHLTPLLVVTMPNTCWFLWWAYCFEDFMWRLHLQLGIRFEGLFWERYYIFWRAKLCLKGIEDFDLHHWCSPVGMCAWDSGPCWATRAPPMPPASDYKRFSTQGFGRQCDAWLPALKDFLHTTENWENYYPD